jgi:hypothetical protein
MAKQKKKRNKQYKGSGAAQTQPVITHVSAVKRGKVQQWWLEKKRVVKPVSIAGGIALAVIIIVIEIIRLFV